MLERWPVQQSSTFMLSHTDTTRISFHCLSPLVSCLHQVVHGSGPAIIYIACATAANYTKSRLHQKNPYSSGLYCAIPHLEDRPNRVLTRPFQTIDRDFCHSQHNHFRLVFAFLQTHKQLAEETPFSENNSTLGGWYWHWKECITFLQLKAKTPQTYTCKNKTVIKKTLYLHTECKVNWTWKSERTPALGNMARSCQPCKKTQETSHYLQ